MNLFGFLLVLKSDLTKLKKNLKTLKSKIKKPKEMESDFLHKAQVHYLLQTVITACYLFRIYWFNTTSWILFFYSINWLNLRAACIYWKRRVQIYRQVTAIFWYIQLKFISTLPSFYFLCLFVLVFLPFFEGWFLLFHSIFFTIFPVNYRIAFY